MIRFSQCLNCKHLRKGKGFGAHCDAYPKGIPDDVAWRLDHRQPIEGDNGIQWEPKLETDKHILDF